MCIALALGSDEFSVMRRFYQDHVVQRYLDGGNPPILPINLFPINARYPK